MKHAKEKETKHENCDGPATTCTVVCVPWAYLFSAWGLICFSQKVCNLLGGTGLML